MHAFGITTGVEGNLELPLERHALTWLTREYGGPRVLGGLFSLGDD